MQPNHCTGWYTFTPPLTVIERVGAGDVKSAVAGTEKRLPDAAKDAIVDSVAKADPKKTPKTVILRVLREVFRGL